jgi:cytochrome oxidase Cu insertion factor (SCO1/SenC/PrrC family)
VAGAVIGDAWHLSQASTSKPLTLPTFHGQGDWAPGQRRAPGFTLRDQAGASVSLAGQRGKPVLVTFLTAARGGGSGPEAASLAQAQELTAGSRRPTVDIIGLDTAADTPTVVRAAIGRWHLKGRYEWLTGTPGEITQLEREYGVGSAPQSANTGAPLSTPLYLVDRAGFERAGYLYPFFPTVLAADLERLYEAHG